MDATPNRRGHRCTIHGDPGRPRHRPETALSTLNDGAPSGAVSEVRPPSRSGPVVVARTVGPHCGGVCPGMLPWMSADENGGGHDTEFPAGLACSSVHLADDRQTTSAPAAAARRL